ncbi:MAG: 30S ribosome-binding factor RbfA [Clostridia bacterium]|nr:30S ribosome-binding factor RbfA [Clostridia bacterium]
MAKYRQDRINDSVAKEVSRIVREIKDPRVASSLITITAANVSQDLKFAKIFYSCIGGDEKEIAKGLSSASGFVRGQIAKRLNLRITPEITFIYDPSVEHGIKIAEILNSLNISSEEENGEEKENK